MKSFIKSLVKRLLGDEQSRRWRENLHSLVALNFLHERRFRKEKMRHSRSEADRIRKALAQGQRRFLITYDAGRSSPTYGDFIYVLLVARFFQAAGLDVTLAFISLDKGDEWSGLSSEQAWRLCSEKIKVARTLLHAANTTIVELDFEGFTQYKRQNPEQYIVFASDVEARFPLYKHAFNLLNQLLASAETSLRDRTLFSFEELRPHIEIPHLPDRPYVACHLRYFQHWGEAQNISREEFRAIYARLRKSFPQTDILVISDKNGCDHFRQLAKEEGFELMFSKDFSPTFLTDALLILKSRFYFQLKGGGIGLFALYSHVPFTFSCYLVNEFKWSRKKLLSWQFPDQVFLDLKKSRKIANIPFRV